MIDLRKELEETASKMNPTPKEVEEEESDNFDDDDLKDVDSMVLTEEEMQKRSALFYTMYKSKLNEPPKEPKAKRPKKKQEKGKRSGTGSMLDLENIQIDYEIADDNADMIDGDADFDDMDFD